MSDKLQHTNEQFRATIAKCRDLFSKKLHDYGAAWRIMRPSSVTDQIFIKANRIRSLEINGEAMVDEGIYPEFQGIAQKAVFRNTVGWNATDSERKWTGHILLKIISASPGRGSTTNSAGGIMEWTMISTK